MTVYAIAKKLGVPYQSLRLWVNNGRREYQFTCKECGTVVQVCMKDQRRGFCSDKCRRRYYSRKYSRIRIAKKNGEREFICKNCGKKFVTEVGDRRRVYCSDYCKNQLHYNRYGRDKCGKKTIVCQHCGKEFETSFGDKRRRYCSEVCCNQHQKLRRQNGYYHPRKATVVKTAAVVAPIKKKCYCAMCGNEFETDSGNEFCSSKCKSWYQKYSHAKNKKLVYDRFLKELENRNR